MRGITVFPIRSGGLSPWEGVAGVLPSLFCWEDLTSVLWGETAAGTKPASTGTFCQHPLCWRDSALTFSVPPSPEG